LQRISLNTAIVYLIQAIFASNSPVSIDAAFLEMIDYKIFNEAAHVDCMLQVQEAKVIGIEGNVKPKITILS
jgi:hypothetical protein